MLFPLNRNCSEAKMAQAARADIEHGEGAMGELLFPGEKRLTVVLPTKDGTKNGEGYWKYVTPHKIFFCCDACGTGTDELEITNFRVTMKAKEQTGILCLGGHTTVYAFALTKHISSAFIGDQPRSLGELLQWPCYICCCNPSIVRVGCSGDTVFTVKMDPKDLTFIRLTLAQSMNGFMHHDAPVVQPSGYPQYQQAMQR